MKKRKVNQELAGNNIDERRRSLKLFAVLCYEHYRNTLKSKTKKDIL